MHLSLSRKCPGALPLFMAAIAMFAACSIPQQGPDNGPPDYITREGGSYLVDLEESSRGRSDFHPQTYSLTYQGSRGETTFEYWAVSGTAGLSLERTLEQLPVNIAPALTPGDGVADLFVAVEAPRSAQDSELTLTVVMDRDWQEAVAEEVFIGTVEFGPGSGAFECRNGGGIRVPRPLEPGYPEMAVRPVAFDRGDQGLAVERFTFTGADNPEGWGGSPVITVSNLPGTYIDLRGRLNNLEFDPGDLVITLSHPVEGPCR